MLCLGHLDLWDMCLKVLARIFTFLDTDGQTFLKASSKFCRVTLMLDAASLINPGPVDSNQQSAAPEERPPHRGAHLPLTRWFCLQAERSRKMFGEFLDPRWQFGAPPPPTGLDTKLLYSSSFLFQTHVQVLKSLIKKRGGPVCGLSPREPNWSNPGPTVA